MIFFTSPLTALAHADSSDGPVALEISSVAPTGAGKSILTFQMIDTAKNKLISESDLSLSHEKKLHMMIKPVISPYLGAVVHVVSTSSDGDALIHVHPMAGSTPNVAMLHVSFQEPGFY